MNIYKILATDFREKVKANPAGLAIRTIPHLSKRMDGLNVFEEGERFAGRRQSGDAEAYITMVASPHVPPSLRLEKLLDTATNILGKTPDIPAGIQQVDQISPQLMVWWKNSSPYDDGRADMPVLAQLPKQIQESFCDAISQQTNTAYKIISSAVDDNPTIWGCWGHAIREERILTGKGRGAPTNKHGHLHVTHFRSDYGDIELNNNLPLAEQVNYYAPWNSVFHGKFSKAIEHMLTLAIANNGAKASAFVESPSEGSLYRNYGHGYQVDYKEPVSLQTTIATLLSTASVLEEFYSTMYQALKRVYTDPDNSMPDMSVFTRPPFHFSPQQAESLAEFIIAMPPTYSELLAWKLQLPLSDSNTAARTKIESRIREYDDARANLGDPTQGDDVELTLMKDSLALPQDYQSVQFTWPVHASVFFTIDNCVVVDDKVKVSAIKIMPSIASTASAVEYKTGTILKRS